MPKCADQRAVGEFAASRYGTFDLRQDVANQLTRYDIRRMQRDGVVEHIGPSLWRFTASTATWRHDLYAATARADAVAARTSAAALLRLDGLERPPPAPHIVREHGRPIDIPGVVVHRTRSLPAVDVTVVDGIRCTTMARTVCDLAGELPADAIFRAIDDIQRRGASMRWLLERALDLRATGRSGPPTVIDIVRRRLDGIGSRTPGSNDCSNDVWRRRRCRASSASTNCAIRPAVSSPGSTWPCRGRDSASRATAAASTSGRRRSATTRIATCARPSRAGRSPTSGSPPRDRQRRCAATSSDWSRVGSSTSDWSIRNSAPNRVRIRWALHRIDTQSRQHGWPSG